MFASVIIVVLLIAGCAKKEVISPLNTPNDEISSLKNASLAGKYIVVLKEDAAISKLDLKARSTKVQEKATGLLKKYEISGVIEEVYETALQGFTVKMAPGQAKKLELDSNVGYIEADKVIALSPIELNGKPGGGGTTPPAQVTPWGVTRVHGGISGDGKTAWVIDTGIDLDHPDLIVDASRSRSFLGGTSTPDDQNGHGSHVAGTIAAKNNAIGVIGVAAGATVVAVRVLDRRGSGTTSGVIAGVNYVASEIQKCNDYVPNVVSLNNVANMSLGGGISSTLDAAVLNASSFCRFSLAAGNETDNANNHSPARVNGTYIYTISAMDNLNKFAYFSNYGSPVDYCSPGVSIYSTYKDGGYATMSGTSMAAPHMAGILLLGDIRTEGTVIGDPDFDDDPIAIH
jgi:subtilisin family serine protease